ncbi:two component transcriptional regulator, LuxR family [Kaistia soli DSM 19436]|uniref:Two component transcriptional regulator, LuxR family n=1 Tax=Kaistia soli DSM 19436 TaxID=1122133 RepID=A0A1M5L687_9HYPH|nr:response regulator [Kaistia soli]SHG60612.1 two component transcriptional regulator, LuxR family [Kaistia soli DSM 19436]
MSEDTGIAFVVDDDQRVCEAVSDLLAAHGIDTWTFGSAANYTAFERPDRAACLLLDIELPDINGLELQTKFNREDHPPIVFITGHGDIQSSVRAMKGGAVDFLTKPFLQNELVASVRAAIELDHSNRRQKSELAILRDRLALLTPREREVLPLVTSGLMNKQAAAKLGVSEVTLQIHRSNITRKMQSTSFADLVRMAEKLNFLANRLIGERVEK